MSETFVGLYKDFDTARKVVEDLASAGFDRSSISLVASDDITRYSENSQNRIGGADGDVEAPEGAGFGAVIGTLVGLGFAVIPGVGPIIAGGTLGAAILSAGVGAVAGAATGGIAAGLINLGIPESDAAYYSEGIRRGGALVGITVYKTWEDQVRKIMNHHHPLDLDQQTAQESNWSSGYDAATPAHNRAVGAVATPTAERTEVRSYSNPPSFETYAPGYRSHYEAVYTHTGHPYDYYLPAYRYGFDLGASNYYRDYRWEEIEPEARRRWEERRPNTWDKVKDAVRNAWDSVLD
ncbi:MAG: hypothetical protein HY862_10040 [Chloroflexi bacterium]|nr:hypothetical protein [Chloroflexota bacterium]